MAGCGWDVNQFEKVWLQIVVENFSQMLKIHQNVEPLV